MDEFCDNEAQEDCSLQDDARSIRASSSDEADAATATSSDEGGPRNSRRRARQRRCVLCQVGGFVFEQKGCVPSRNTAVRAIMKQYTQTLDQLPRRKRYANVADMFNRRVVQPAIATGFAEAYPHIRKITTADVQRHFTKHATPSDQEVVATHQRRLHALATHIWDKELMAADKDGNIAMHAGMAKLMLDVQKAYASGQSALRDMRAQDRLESAALADVEATEYDSMIGGANAAVAVGCPPRRVLPLSFFH